MRDDVHGDGEDDGGVLLSRDRVQGLEVAELQKRDGWLVSGCRPCHYEWQSNRSCSLLSFMFKNS